MTSKIVRLGLVGCGFFARNHLNAWRDLRAQGVEIVALCDTDRAKAEQAARDFGVPEIYTDFSQMLGDARRGAAWACGYRHPGALSPSTGRA